MLLVTNEVLVPRRATLIDSIFIFALARVSPVP
jgi:hypothetical protein